MTTWYVRGQGNDDNTGLSRANAFATTQEAANHVRPGDDVFVFNVEQDTAFFTDTARTKWHGENWDIDPPAGKAGAYLQADGILFEGATLHDGEIGGIAAKGQGIKIIDNEVFHFGTNGISYSGDGGTISGNRVYDVGHKGSTSGISIRPYEIAGGTDHGFKVDHNFVSNVNHHTPKLMTDGQAFIADNNLHGVRVEYDYRFTVTDNLWKDNMGKGALFFNIDNFVYKNNWSLNNSLNSPHVYQGELEMRASGRIHGEVTGNHLVAANGNETVFEFSGSRATYRDNWTRVVGEPGNSGFYKEPSPSLNHWGVSFGGPDYSHWFDAGTDGIL